MPPTSATERTPVPSFCRPGPWPEDRRCSRIGCITPLSSYHEGTECYAHENEQVQWPDRNELAELMQEAPGA